MAEVQQRVLAAACAAVLLCAGGLDAKKFYDDDPIWRVPPPMNVGNPAERKMEDLYQYLYMSFGKPGEKARPEAPIPAGAVNTLGEVPDSEWYTNRHGRKRMTIEELVRGPGNQSAPSTDGPWMVTAAKTEGVTPGFTIKDSKGRRYQIKFDSRLNFELPTGADVIGSKFFYALGYETPENYVVYFNSEQLAVEKGARIVDYRGVEREMRQTDITSVLRTLPRDKKTGLFRAVASLYLKGKPLGPFAYHGVRSDDPNDVVPHEHRRDLRGLKIFAAWLNHTDAKPLNSLDMLVERDGRRYIQHHLIDFSAMLGTDAFEPKSPRAGHVFMLDWPEAAKTFFTLGMYFPEWMRADSEHKRGIGRIESDVFDPEKWKSHYYNPAFDNCLPDDAFWAAKQVMRFTEPEIRALVGTGKYSDSEAVDHLVKILVERQQKIGRSAFSRVLPLDNVRVERGALRFDDLAVQHRLSQPRSYRISWAVFDNETGKTEPIASAAGETIPRNSARYLLATIDSGDPRMAVRVYLRNSREVVGIERTWREMPAAAVEISHAEKR